MSNSETPQSIYGQEYYKSHLGDIPYERNEHWLNFFGGIADNLVRALRPSSVFDAGCAWGFLVEAFHDRGVDARGRDISAYAIACVRPDIRYYCDVGSLTQPIEGRYDLITCIEVLEHMPEEEARLAIHNMCTASASILFSSSPSDFGEESHINVHSPLYWMKAFEEEKFSPDIAFDASFVSPHAFLLRSAPNPLSREVLTLMSEKLRWHREWVTAHQVFCLASDRAIASARQSETLIREIGEVRQSAHELERTLQERNAQNVELRRELVHSVERETQSALLATRLREAADAQKRRVEQTEMEREELRQRTETEFARKLVFRDRELESIRSSPAWRLISTYREWLDRNRQKSWVRNYLEPTLLWTLERVGIGRSTGGDGDPTSESAPTAPGTSFTGEIATTVPPLQDVYRYEDWIREFEPGSAELVLQRDISGHFVFRPKISVITPVYKVPLNVVRELIDSVRGQTYGNWQLCLVHAWPGGKDVRDYLGSVAAEDPRVRLLLLDENHGIGENSNRALELADGEYATLLDHDDTLAPSAFFETVRVLNERGPAELVYSDKDQLLDGSGQRIAPLFKPQWSPDIMLSANFLTHVTTMRTDAIRATGGWRSATDGAQDWDLFLRVIGGSKRVWHIPKVLYHWRQIATSVAGGGMAAKPYAAEAQLRTLRDHFARNGWNAEILLEPEPRIRWKAPSNQEVSVILMAPPGSADLSELARTFAGAGQGQPIEVLFGAAEVPVLSGVANDTGIRAIQAVPDDSLAESLNRLAAEASGDILVFIDANVKPLSPGWLQELAGPLQMAGAGIVGARLLDPDTLRMRHAGIAFNDSGDADYIFSGEPEHLFGEFGGAGWYRDWSAVSGACFSIRRSTFESLGGFCQLPSYPRLDIDLCLRVQFEANLRVLYNPFARFVQSSAATIEIFLSPDKGRQYVRSNFPDGDPYFNPNIVLDDSAIALRRRYVEQPKATDYAADSQVFVRDFDFNPAAVDKSRLHCQGTATGEVKSLTWFIPEFTNSFYGGIHTILRFADYFLRVHGVVSRFAVLGQCHPSVIRGRIGAAFPELAARCDVRVIAGMDSIEALPECDGAFATLWTTAYALLHFTKTRRKFYFSQDYEPLFYPSGSASALVEATYDFGFHGICNTVQLQQLYSGRGGEADYFDPCIDPRIFNDVNRKPAGGKPLTVFCYARPGHPRNGFELLTAALRIVKKRLGEDVRIVTAGADWDPAAFGLQEVLHNLGNLGYATTGALYRACDVGVVMMMTCHPSYLPFELMACGSLVVTNRNPHTSWLLRDGENCLLAEGSASSLAERIVEGLSDSGLRDRITKTARDLIVSRYSDWDAQAEKIYQCLRRIS